MGFGFKYFSWTPKAVQHLLTFPFFNIKSLKRFDILVWSEEGQQPYRGWLRNQPDDVGSMSYQLGNGRNRGLFLDKDGIVIRGPIAVAHHVLHLRQAHVLPEEFSRDQTAQ
jgi:hypothetical protein